MAAQVSSITLPFWIAFTADVHASANSQPGTARRQLYEGVLSQLRAVLIRRMAQLEQARTLLRPLLMHAACSC
jgi:hypothetical protein